MKIKLTKTLSGTLIASTIVDIEKDDLGHAVKTLEASGGILECQICEICKREIKGVTYIDKKYGKICRSCWAIKC